MFFGNDGYSFFTIFQKVHLLSKYGRFSFSCCFKKHATWASMRLLGAKYAATFGCMSMPVGCMSMDWLGACMRLLGAKYMDTFGCVSIPFGCMSMGRLGACMRLLGACLTVGSFPQAPKRGPWASGPLDHGPRARGTFGPKNMKITCF